jgi:hypothetical protein
MTAIPASGWRLVSHPARYVAAVDDEGMWGCALIADESRAFIGSRAGKSKTSTFQEILETYAHEQVLAQENSLGSRILQSDLNGPCSIRMLHDALIKGLELVMQGNPP